MIKSYITVYILSALVHVQCASSEDDPIQAYQFQTEHFTFNYTSLDNSNIRIIADSLENNWQRITSNLNVSEMPKVTVTLYGNQEILHEAVRKIIPTVPSWATGFATSVDQIHVLSPNHPTQSFHGMLRNIIHEFAHCVTQKISSTFPNNPRWLWESVAIHQARQFISPNQLSYMINHEPPSLSELNSFSNSYIYDIGFLFTEFILHRWNSTKLTDLIAAHGDIQAVLGVAENDFYEQWFEFVKTKYKF